LCEFTPYNGYHGDYITERRGTGTTIGREQGEAWKQTQVPQHGEKEKAAG